MRIPQVIDFNVQEVYRPSKISWNLIGEQKRRIHTEDFMWDNDVIPTLALICLHAIADNFHNRPVLLELDLRDQDHIQELISTELPLELVVPLIEAEQYWKRRYQTHYSLVPHQIHLGWTYKCLYLERYLRGILEQAEPQYKDEETFQSLLNLFAPYIHVLLITQLRHWIIPNTMIPEEYPQVLPIYHISFLPILKYLPNLIQLEICYGMNDIGEDYDVHKFQLAVEDCENLGKAILVLKHLKILRLHKSEVECKHVQALVRNLMKNTSLVELDLSHCKIGDLGAKCLGKMLTVHETLKVLILSNNVIGEQGAYGIAWALLVPEGAHLQMLDLSLNPLRGPGVATLMRALVRGILPRNLSIAHCGIVEETVHYVTCMIIVNTSLQRLNISGNVFGESGGKKLLASMESNPGLIQIDMRDTKIPNDIQQEIRILLKRNFDSHPSEEKLSTNAIFTELISKKTSHYSDGVSKVSTELSCSFRSEFDSSLKNYYLGQPDPVSNPNVRTEPITKRVGSIGHTKTSCGY